MVPAPGFEGFHWELNGYFGGLVLTHVSGPLVRRENPKRGGNPFPRAANASGQVQPQAHAVSRAAASPPACGAGFSRAASGCVWGFPVLVMVQVPHLWLPDGTASPSSARRQRGPLPLLQNQLCLFHGPRSPALVVSTVGWGLLVASSPILPGRSCCSCVEDRQNPSKHHIGSRRSPPALLPPSPTLETTGSPTPMLPGGPGAAHQHPVLLVPCGAGGSIPSPPVLSSCLGLWGPIPAAHGAQPHAPTVAEAVPGSRDEHGQGPALFLGGHRARSGSRGSCQQPGAGCPAQAADILEGNSCSPLLPVARSLRNGHPGARLCRQRLPGATVGLGRRSSAWGRAVRDPR